MDIRTSIVTAVVLSSLLATSDAALAQEPNVNQSPELQVLQRFVGEWEETVELKLAPWNESIKKITSTRKSILGGTMIENRGIWSPEKVEFLHLLSYDPKRREYRNWYFDANNPASFGQNRGRWDEAKQTMTWRGEQDDGVTTEGIDRWTDKDNFTWTFVARDRSGKVVSEVEAKVKRRKR
jgi:hypothetical protein